MHRKAGENLNIRHWACAVTAVATCLAASSVAALTPSSGPAPQPAENFLWGSEPAGPAKPTPRLPDGHPDFTGFWKALQEGKPIGNIGRDLPGFKLPLTPEGERALEFNRTKTVDPEARCILGGIPRHDASALPFEILHTPKRLAFLYFYQTHRFVALDGRRHEEDPDPRYFGDEVGSWEGDTLVVDAVGFKDSKDGRFWIDENADPQSDQSHIIERWTRPDADHLHLELTVIDPKYYTHPFTFTRTWVLGRGEPGLSEYACAEDNVDLAHLGPGPGYIGPDGQRGYGAAKLPKDPPGPEAYEKKK